MQYCALTLTISLGYPQRGADTAIDMACTVHDAMIDLVLLVL